MPVIWLQEEQAKEVTAISEKLYEYRSMNACRLVSSWFMMIETLIRVCFNEKELAHDFASVGSGDSMEP